jgi:nucleotide-binding universal stress UspA family protein
MQHALRADQFQASRFTPSILQLDRDIAAAKFCFRRILVPFNVETADRSGLLLGFQLAAVHQAALTLLHVEPPTKGGLDALELLHAAAESFRSASADRMSRRATGAGVQTFITDAVPPDLRSAVDWQEECRYGKLAETVVAEVNRSGADLVILPTTLFPWWLPRALDMWSIRRRVRASVIVIRDRSHSLVA